MLRTIKELNRKIDEKVDSVKEEDIEMVNLLKQEVQDIEDERDMAIARKSFVKMQLEGERPTRFFCKINKKDSPKLSLKKYILKKWTRMEEKP